MSKKLSNPHVLIVEDEWFTTLVLHRHMEQAGCVVRHSSTLAGALAFLGIVSFRFVLTDLLLPDGDGIEIIKEVRRRRLRTKVIVCTGAADPLRIEAVREAGADRIFLKPTLMTDVIDYMGQHESPTDDVPVIKG